MLREGNNCAFDPVVFKNAISEIVYTNYQVYAKTYMNTIYGASMHGFGEAAIEEVSRQYLKTDVTQLFPDKVWVSVFYESEEVMGFRYNIRILSLVHGICTLSFSSIILNINTVEDILYDEFGMVPMSRGFVTETWLRHRFQNLIWEERNIDKLIGMVEDPFLKSRLTTLLLEEFLEKTTEYEWPEATMVLIRAIHDRKEGSQDKQFRL